MLGRSGYLKPHLSFDPVRPQFATPRFVPTGSIQATPRTIGGTIEGLIGKGLNKLGLSEKRAAQYGSRIMAPLTDVTPVGDAIGAEEGVGLLSRGISKGDLRTGALGLGSLLLSVLPYGQTAKRPLKSLLADTSGAIRAWHGSPHDFDRFDMSKIGTGEGAQAYGHGLYFAENKDVAQQYQNILSNRSKATDDPASAAGFWLGMNNGDRDATIKTFENMKAQNQRILDRVAQRLPVAPGAAGHALSEIHAADEALAHLASGTEAKSGGRLYEVNINAEPGDFLDWDAPLSSHPEQLRQSLGSALSPEELRVLTATDASGRDLHSFLENRNRGEYGSGSRFDASAALRGAGVPGLRYLDQGSRNAADGTRNYVVFDDSLIDILNKF